MKLILSRKGFDSGSGGGASLITTNNDLISLPIPDDPGVGHPTSYNQISSAAGNLGPIVSTLTNGKIRGTDLAHLDPDLDKCSLSRAPGNWAPAFGQRDKAAAPHLDNYNVGVGDLFIFFGWFCRYDLTAGKPIKGAVDLHVIFGWLQIGNVFRNNDIPTKNWKPIVGFDWEVTSAYPGQEFIIDTDLHPDALAWAVDLFANR